jgi:hypothetical protein
VRFEGHLYLFFQVMPMREATPTLGRVLTLQAKLERELTLHPTRERVQMGRGLLLTAKTVLKMVL